MTGVFAKVIGWLLGTCGVPCELAMGEMLKRSACATAVVGGDCPALWSSVRPGALLLGASPGPYSSSCSGLTSL